MIIRKLSVSFLLLLALLLSGCGGKTSSGADKLKSFVNKGSTVEEYAQKCIEYWAAHFQEGRVSRPEIVDTKLDTLERLGRFEGLLDYPVEVWRLEYELKPDTMDKVWWTGTGMYNGGTGGWLCFDAGAAKPCLVVAYENDKQEFLGLTDTKKMAEQGGPENAVRAFLEQEGRLPKETYPGNHAWASFIGPDHTVLSLVLSQPVRQGGGGIWCVERYYDFRGGAYLVSPEKNGAALDAYGLLQAACDGGEHQDLLDPSGAALRFISDTLRFDIAQEDLILWTEGGLGSDEDLDYCVSREILKHNSEKLGDKDPEYKTEAHYTVSVKQMTDAVSVCAVAWYGQYDYKDDRPNETGAAGGSAVLLTFDKKDGKYILKDYWEAPAGCPPELIKAKFPADADKILTLYNGLDGECYSRARAYFIEQNGWSIPIDDVLGAPFAIGPDDKPLIIEYNYDRSLEELHFTDMTIPSFDFLAEFKNLKFLSITSCAVPEGVTLPRLETLTGLSVYHTEGADAFSLVKDCLPLPNLKSLSLVDSEEGFVLPRIDTLERLEISVPNVLEIIANNHHVLTLLLGDGTLGLQNLNGLERFKNMTYLSVLEDVRDISALSGCESLRLLIVDHAPGLRTLKPLYNLEHLEEIIMDQAAYRYLPQEDKDHFSGENRDAARIYFYD